MWSRTDLRYGVFLLPDARTSAAVTRITTYLHAQYGFVSTGRFPPHGTLAGSLPLAVSEADLIAAVHDVANRHSAVPVVNSGPRQLWDSVLAFDVHEDGSGHPNSALVDLAVDVIEMARPRLGPVGDLPADPSRTRRLARASVARQPRCPQPARAPAKGRPVRRAARRAVPHPLRRHRARGLPVSSSQLDRRLVDPLHVGTGRSGRTWLQRRGCVSSAPSHRTITPESHTLVAARAPWRC